MNALLVGPARRSRSLLGRGLGLGCLLATLMLARTSAAEDTALQQLAWMAGAWTGSDGGVEMEEHWIAPRGGTLLGVHRDLAGGRTVFFEYLRIEATPEGIVYFASPRGQPPTPFRLVKSEGQRVVFENLAHDYPQRILYWLDGDGRLHARIEGPKGGKTVSKEWIWRRMP